MATAATTLFFLRFVVAATATATTVGVAVSLSRSFSGGTATTVTTAAAAGGRLLVTAATTRAASATAAHGAASGAARLAVTHQVNTEVREVTQVACKGIASTGAGDDNAAVAQRLQNLVDHGPLLNIVGNGNGADHVHGQGSQRAQGLVVTLGQVNHLGGGGQAQNRQHTHEHHGHRILRQQYGHANSGGSGNALNGLGQLLRINVAGDVENVVGVHGNGAGA